MKMKALLAITVVAFGWSACKSPETEQADHHSHSSESMAPLEKNQGEKWQVNEEMKPYVQQGEESVITYIDEARTDYKQLAAHLKEQNELLIQHCTMEGKSHDELHKWLHPHMKKVDDLSRSKDDDEAMKKVHELLFSYQTYHEYFE